MFSEAHLHTSGVNAAVDSEGLCVAHFDSAGGPGLSLLSKMRTGYRLGCMRGGPVETACRQQGVRDEHWRRIFDFVLASIKQHAQIYCFGLFLVPNVHDILGPISVSCWHCPSQLLPGHPLARISRSHLAKASSM